MHNISQGQNFKLPKSPLAKAKHARDDSSLDKSTKLKTVQSCRRITTEQSGKISTKFNDTILKKQLDPKSPKQSHKLNSQMQTISLLKTNKYSSCKNLKNLKLSSSVNKKIQNYLHLFSPKNKPLPNHNLSKDAINKDLSTNINLKPALKKAAGNKTTLIGKVNKLNQQDKITPFVPYPANDDKLLKSGTQNKNVKKLALNKSKQQKPVFKLQAQTKSKALKTLQNEQIQAYKHRNSNKCESQKKKKIERQKMYHNVKMKTEQSMISCESTPSQIFYHDIEFLELIGQGTFGQVYKAIVKKSSQVVAIKKVYQDKKYKNREIEIVSLLNSSNFIMKVLGTYMTYEGGNSQSHKQYLNIVMKYYESDLYKDIQMKKSLSNIEMKIYTYQIFRGLLYLHSKNICHRDIKPHNILTNKMSVAICDFGSAKILQPQQKNLPYICSRCYRAPELIFGSTQYTTMIDVWSVGCVVLQMIHGSPYFIGNSSIDHLIEVIKVLGTPTKTQVKEMNPEYDLKDYKFPNIKRKSLAKLFPSADPDLINLLEQILIYAPKQRLNAAQALNHYYFDELRQEQTYLNLCKTYDLPDFFDFTPEQMKQNEHLYGQLVPEWYSKIHQTYFEDEQIEKNNTLKFYFD